jgi:hypothetical protein
VDPRSIHVGNSFETTISIQMNLGEIDGFNYLTKHLADLEPNKYTTFCVCLDVHYWMKQMEKKKPYHSFNELFESNLKTSIFNSFVPMKHDKLVNTLPKPLTFEKRFISVKSY